MERLVFPLGRPQCYFLCTFYPFWGSSSHSAGTVDELADILSCISSLFAFVFGNSLCAHYNKIHFL